jgi:DNA-binding MarR family transcriptional regulator
MRKKGLLTRNRSDDDKRVSIISLTPLGEELAVQSSAIWNDTEEILCETLNAEEKECFIVLARRMAANLRKLLYHQPTDRN